TLVRFFADGAVDPAHSGVCRRGGGRAGSRRAPAEKGVVIKAVILSAAKDPIGMAAKVNLAGDFQKRTSCGLGSMGFSLRSGRQAVYSRKLNARHALNYQKRLLRDPGGQKVGINR